MKHNKFFGRLYKLSRAVLNLLQNFFDCRPEVVVYIPASSDVTYLKDAFRYIKLLRLRGFQVRVMIL